MNERLQTRAEGCLSDLVFDQLLAGEGTAAAEETARAHLATCEACRARNDALTKEREAFADAAGPLALPARSASHRARRTWGARGMGAGAVIAMAAAVFLFVRAKPTDDVEGTRSKGSSHVGFYVKRGASITRGASGERVRPGDSIRFEYSAATSRYLAIVSVDGAGRASIYFPDGARAARVEAGVDRPLDVSTVLDETLGDERIYALFCRAPIPLDPVRAGLEASRSAPSIEGCDIDALTLQKGPPPAP